MPWLLHTHGDERSKNILNANSMPPEDPGVGKKTTAVTANEVPQIIVKNKS